MVILTCFHGRPKVSEAWLAHTTAFGDVIAAVSEGDAANIALCERYNVRFMEFPNDPLGAKWNAAMWLVPPDERIMVLGSDDFISREWWDMCMASDADLVRSLCSDHSTKKQQSGCPHKYLQRGILGPRIKRRARFRHAREVPMP